MKKRSFFTGFFSALFALQLFVFTASADFRADVYERAESVFNSGGGYIDLSGISLSVSDNSAAISEINRAWTESCVFRVGDISTAAATYSPVYNGETLVGANIFYRTDYINVDGKCEIERMKADISAVSEEFSAALTLVTSEMSELEKAVIFHDYIVNRADYAEKTVQPDGSLNYAPDEYNSVGVFLDGKAVCSGYASAYAALLRASGIEAVVVTSVEMNHDWTMLKIDGNWYHADCTWDDSENGIIYDYFLKSDEEFIQLEHYGWTVGTDSGYGGYGAVAPIADKSGAFDFGTPKEPIVTTAVQTQESIPEATTTVTTKSAEATAIVIETNAENGNFPIIALVLSVGIIVIAAVIISKNGKERRK